MENTSCVFIIYFLRFYPIHQLLLQSLCRLWILDKLIDLKAGGEEELRWFRSVEKLLWIFPDLIVGPTDHWLVQRPRHHFPKIIFLVFINCGTGVKLNKNSEIEIHSNILKCDRRMDISDVVKGFPVSKCTSMRWSFCLIIKFNSKRKGFARLECLFIWNPYSNISTVFFLMRSR